MWKRLHLKLTLLNTGITSLVMIALSVLCLFFSESAMWKNSFYAFQKDMDSLYANMEEQTYISQTWLSRMESGGLRIFLLDNGAPYLHNHLSHPGETGLFEQALAFYQASSPERTEALGMKSFHREFVFNSSLPQSQGVRLSDGDYYVSGAEISKGKNALTVLVLSPLDRLHSQALRQRLLVFGWNLVGLCLLYLFSWFFTGRLLLPIRQNQEQQLRFLASSSHELRTPLAVILASASACEIAPSEKQKAFLSNIKEEGLRMQQLLSELLAMSAGGPSTKRIEKQPVSPDTIALNAYEHFLPLMQREEMRFQILLPEEEIPLISCNESKIYQALSILLQNAMSYTEKGGNIELALTVAPRYVSFSVSDTGCGIPDREKKKIFERFYRADASHNDKSHFGLGLSIAADIAAVHNGRIQVTDHLPRGSVFTLTLPRKQA